MHPNPDSEIAAFVRRARQASGKSQEEFGQLFGRTKGNVSAWETGRHEPAYAVLDKMSAETRVPLPSSLRAISKGVTATERAVALEMIAGDSPRVGSRRLPLIDYTHVMAWLGPQTTVKGEKWELTDMELSEHAFALEIDDDSTAPRFNRGDVLIIDRVRPRQGDYVIAKSGSRKSLLAKYRSYGLNKEGIEVIEITPVDPDEPPMRSDFSTIEIIGVMMERRSERRQP